MTGPFPIYALFAPSGMNNREIIRGTTTNARAPVETACEIVELTLASMPKSSTSIR